MENATKALMIAGAVLLAIMIIGVGMLIFNSANGTIGNATSRMSQQEKDLFNSQFTSYEGSRVLGSNVKALISTIIASNNQALEEDTLKDKGIELKVGSENAITPDDKDTKASDMEAARRKIVSGQKYVVDISVDQQTGLVHTVTISQGKGGETT